MLVAEWLPTLRNRSRSRKGKGRGNVGGGTSGAERHRLRVNELCKQFLITCLFGSHSISYFLGRLESGIRGKQVGRQGAVGVVITANSKAAVEQYGKAAEEQSSRVAQQPIDATISN